MGFFYDRTETADNVTIRMKNMLIYYFLYFALMISFLVSMGLGNIYPIITCTVSPLLILALIAFWLFGGMREANSAVKRAMRKGKVTISGSRWSNSNPLTYEIPKSLLEEKK
jgi:hypothetical protein